MTFRHVPQIDPNWPAVFRAPEWWERKPHDRLGPAPHTHRPWTDDQLRTAAAMLKRRASWQAIACAVEHSYSGIAQRIAVDGGVEAFIAKYAGGGEP